MLLTLKNTEDMLENMKDILPAKEALNYDFSFWFWLFIIIVAALFAMISAWIFLHWRSKRQKLVKQDPGSQIHHSLEELSEALDKRTINSKDFYEHIFSTFRFFVSYKYKIQNLQLTEQDLLKKIKFFDFPVQPEALTAFVQRSFYYRYGPIEGLPGTAPDKIVDCMKEDLFFLKRWLQVIEEEKSKKEKQGKEKVEP